MKRSIPYILLCAYFELYLLIAHKTLLNMENSVHCSDYCYKYTDVFFVGWLNIFVNVLTGIMTPSIIYIKLKLIFLLQVLQTGEMRYYEHTEKSAVLNIFFILYSPSIFI
jgi:hypothetical protein